MKSVLVSLIAFVGCTANLDLNSQDPLTNVRPIYFYDWTGKKTDHLQFIANDTTIAYSVVPGVSGTDWEIIPPLPEGFSFSKSDLVLESRYQGEFKSQQFTIQLSKGGTVLANATFYLEAVPCSDRVIYSVEQGKGSYVVEIRQNSQLVRNGTISGGKTMCLPKGKLEVKTLCYGQVFDSCLLQFVDPAGLVLHRSEFIPHQSESFTVDPNPKEAPSFGEFKKDFYTRFRSLKSFSIPIFGAHYPVEFDPPLPDDLVWSSLYQHINVNADRGSYKFTLTIHNAVGKASTNIGIYVDTCPEPLYLLAPRATGTNQENITITDSEGRVVMREYMNGAVEANTCVPAGEYDVTITMLEERYPSDYTLNFMEENGDFMESFIRNRGLETDVHRITLGNAVPFGSSFRFLIADHVDAKWTQRKFNDRKWNEGVSGHWGSFSSPSAFFRKQFSVKDLSFQSVVQVATKAVGDVTLYVNGAYLRRYMNVNATRVHTTIPTSFLSKGDNIICAEVHGANAETIVFDLSVHLSRSWLLHRPQKGIASDSPKQESSSYSAQYAFEKKKFSSDTWKSVSIPVNLTFLFTDLHRSWINRILFSPYFKDNAPVDFEIDGLITVKKGNEMVIKEADTLGRIVNPSFGFTHRYYEFDFTPKRFYDGFRFRFNKGYANDSIAVNFISFYMRSPLRCKRSGTYKSALLGERLTGRCSMKQTGYRAMRCVPDMNGKPVWERDDSMCVDRYAPRGLSFVDTKIVVTPLADGWLDMFYDKMRSVVMKNLTIWKEQISFPVERFLDDTDTQREVMMRFTVEEEIGDYILKKLKEEATGIERQITTTMSAYRPCTITVDRNPTYRSPFPWHTVWWVVLVAVLLVVSNLLTAICVKLSSRSHVGEQGVKRLKKQGALLDDQAPL